MIGQSVGNYRITGQIGQGGMGTVYLAEHPGFGRRAAVKVLRPELAREPQLLQQLQAKMAGVGRTDDKVDQAVATLKDLLAANQPKNPKRSASLAVIRQ